MNAGRQQARSSLSTRNQKEGQEERRFAVCQPDISGRYPGSVMHGTSGHTKAVQCFLYAGLAGRMKEIGSRMFWEQVCATSVPDRSWFPALAATVRWGTREVLFVLTEWRMPGKVPAQAEPWYEELVAAWKKRYDQCRGRPWLRELREEVLLGLVRLDGCAVAGGNRRQSCLTEWLEIGRVGVPAPLAAWCPAPGRITPQTQKQWIDFWQGVRRSANPVEKGIAAQALINLGGRERESTRNRLWREVTDALVSWDIDSSYPILPKVIGAEGSDGRQAPEWFIMRSAEAWMEKSRSRDWWVRKTAWRYLGAENRPEKLKRCGINLLPRMVAEVGREQNPLVLWEMAGWNVTGASPEDIRQLETAWRNCRKSGCEGVRAAGWRGSIELYRSGSLRQAGEDFPQEYLKAVAREEDGSVILALAQWVPGVGDSPEVHRMWRRSWVDRLKQGHADIYQIYPGVALALLRQVFRIGPTHALRATAMDTRSAGLQIPSLLSFRHFYNIQETLANGSVPDFRYWERSPAKEQYPRLVLPPGRIADMEWRIENGELKMENDGAGLEPESR